MMAVALYSTYITILMAELLKYFYPKLVDLHNYRATCSKACKIDNWAVLNRKVFSKLNIKLSPKLMEQLADAVPGVVDSLLIQLRARIEELREQLQSPNTSGSASESELVISSINDLSSKLVPADKKSQKKVLVSSDVLTSLKQDIAVKEEAIVILKDKVNHLENLIELKNQRIRDLTTQLGRYHLNMEPTTASPLPRQCSCPP
ncbi:sperm flagellar protein 1 isoform X2 [Anabrus simplex]|uniref:sperm flagellar protein 1 isoform X2 n=1 Tax=Anabrus simplex TaxID=316456 RepID=UPI0034DDA615